MGELFITQSTSLEKVMPYHENFSTIDGITALRGERVSWQISLKATEMMILNYMVISDLSKYISIRRVGYVPVELASYEHDHDDDFISLDAGLYPDVLYPLEKNVLSVKVREYTTIMITVDLPDNVLPGDYDVKILFTCNEKNTSNDVTFKIHVIDACMPKNNIKYTQWIHADCIANYYNCEIFSQKHWDMIEKFIALAVKTGINLIFTPLFTPPLDTKFGEQRPTVQLVDVYKKKDKYIFEFDNLKRWMDICRSYGVNAFEFSHMLTQWGAKYAPKIMAHTENGLTRIFGWETDSGSEKFENFLRQFYESFDEFLKEEKGEFYIHIADEPDEENKEYYLHGYRIISECMKDYKIIDAVSEVDIYKSEISKYPVANINQAEEIFECGVNERWIYYSCANNKEVSNRYIAMPSYRNRCIGLQFYKYEIDGFLHWGFNFYNSGLSDYNINPFSVTDSYGLMPGGDSFSVYPYQNGPIESIRTVVFYEALQDLGALKLLESLVGREEVLKLLEEDGAITFKKYPRSNMKLFEIREKINKKIEEKLRR